MVASDPSGFTSFSNSLDVSLAFSSVLVLSTASASSLDALLESSVSSALVATSDLVLLDAAVSVAPEALFFTLALAAALALSRTML